MSGYEGQRRDLHRLKVCPHPVLVLDDALHAIKQYLGRMIREAYVSVVGSDTRVAHFSICHMALISR